MRFRILRTSGPFTQLMFATLVVLILAVVALFVGFLLAMPIFHLSIGDMGAAMTNFSSPQGVVLMKYFQTIQAIGIFVIPPFIIAWVLSERPISYLHLDKITTFKSIILVMVLVYFANPMINWMAEFNSGLQLPDWLSGVQDWMKASEDQADQITKAFLHVEGLGGMFFNLFMIGLLPAIGEELLFRGIVQRILKDWTKNAHAAIWLSAALFSALHMQFFGFLPRMMLGALFGYLLEWSGSLWIPMIGHFINNGSAVIISYLIDKGVVSSSVEKVGTSDGQGTYLAILSLIFVMVLLRSFYVQVRGAGELWTTTDEPNPPID